MLKLVEYSSWGTFFVLFLGWCREKKFVTFEKTNSFKCGGVRAGFGGIVTVMSGGRCLGWCREKKFVTFEKTNSFKRGGVRTWLIGLVTIITGVRCLGA